MKDKKMKIRQAAIIAGIGYENAKVIKRIYRKEGRDTKICFKNKPRNFRRGDVFINPELEVQNNKEKAKSALKVEIDESSASVKDSIEKQDSDRQLDSTSSGSSKNLK